MKILKKEVKTEKEKIKEKRETSGKVKGEARKEGGLKKL